LKKYIKFLKELCVMATEISSLRFWAIWIVALIVALGKTVHWIRWW